jgi:integrase
MGVRVREKDGNWYLFINHHNRRAAKKIGPATKENFKRANRLAERLRVELAFRERIDEPPTLPTLAEYADSWLNSVRTLRKTATWEAYSRHMTKFWVPALGKYRLDEVTRPLIKRVLIKLQDEGLNPGYVRNILTALQSCLAEAVDEELIKANPADRQGRNIAKETPTAIEVFTEDELRHLLDVARRDMPALYPKLFIMARTGMREGEMLTLQYGDLDFARRKIVVRRTWGSRNARKNLLCINTPKSGKARHIDMSPQLAEVLQTWLPHPRAATDWLFPGASGTRPMTPNGFTYLWERLLKRADLAHRGPHAVRHSYASILLDRGENPLYVKEQLGHASIRITMDTYGHLLRKKGPAGVATLDDPEICNLSATTALRLVAADGTNTQ